MDMHVLILSPKERQRYELDRGDGRALEDIRQEGGKIPFYMFKSKKNDII